MAMGHGSWVRKDGPFPCVDVVAGASVDERDALGYTALMLAVRCGNYDEAAMLLFEGQASTTLRDDEYRRTAVEWAELGSPLSSRSPPRRSSRSEFICTHGNVTGIFTGLCPVLGRH